MFFYFINIFLIITEIQPLPFMVRALMSRVLLVTQIHYFLLPFCVSDMSRLIVRNKRKHSV